MAKAQCRINGQPLQHTFVDLGMFPLANAYLHSHQLNQAEKFYPLHAYVSKDTLLVQLEQFETSDNIFSDYAYFSSYSESWLRHAKSYTGFMVKKFGFNQNTQIIEIASNDGYNNKLLTIAIPTYNRAQLLDRQIAWLVDAIKGFETDCEILVSDNCSTDNTPEIVKKWQSQVSNITFRYNRNTENLGVIKNINYCLKTATTKYVWTIGDDDPIQTRAVSYVLNKVKEKEDISLIFLNFSGRNQITGEDVHPPTIVGNRWFDANADDGNGDSKAIYQHCFEKSIGAVIFLTATIYKTELVKEALNYWPEAENNWIFLAYLAGYCAARGRIIVTTDNFMECVVGVSYWQKEPKSALLMQYKDTPEVIMKLEETGYSKQFCRRMILHSFREANLKVLLGALRRWPLYTLQIVIPFWRLVAVSALYLMKLNKQVDKTLHPIKTGFLG